MINYNLKLDCQGDKVLSSDMVFVSGDVKAYKLIFDFRDGERVVDINNCVLVYFHCLNNLTSFSGKPIENTAFTPK